MPIDLNSLPKYSKDTKNEVFGAITDDLMEFATNFKHVPASEKVSALCYAKVVDGFGHGLIILSTNELDEDIRKKFCKVFSYNILFERAIEAKLLGGGTELDEVQIPNWEKAGVTTLPGYGDAQSRVEFVSVVVGALYGHMAWMAKFINNKKPSTDDIIRAVHTLLFSYSIIGTMRGLNYGRPSDFTNMVYPLPTGKKFPPIELVGILEGKLNQFSIGKRLDAVVDRAIAKAKARG